MKIARYLSLLIAMLLCLFIGAAGAETTSATTTYTVDAETLGLPSNDELFAYYVEQQMFGYEWVTWGTAAREQLSVQQKLVYDVLRAKIEDVAAYGGSTNFVFVPSNIPGFDNTFTLTELGVSAFFETVNGQTSFTAEAAAALDKAIFGSVFDALVFDCPMDLYWFDKVVSNAMQQGYSASSSGDTLTINQLIITMQVARAYQGANTTVVKPSNLDTVLANAKAVVAANKDKSAPEMLKAFKEYICNAVSYNEDAAADDYNGGYGDPWQLIYVFDGDSSTNVVCEGYAKAFQYLCDIAQSEYNVLQDISVITVTGYMSGGTGAGPHMWNVVTMDDGKNYIVDVTNSEAGTVGEDGELFLGGTSDTTPHWIVDKSDGSSWGGIYVFKYGTGNNDYVQYNYDNPLPYSDKELALAPYNYTNVTYVADVNGTKYEVFNEAVTAWILADGTSTLKLLANVTDFHAGIEKSDRILDLNGFAWQNKIYQNMVLQVKSDGSLVIQDSVGTGKIARSDANGPALRAMGSLTILGSVNIDAPIDISIANGSVDLTNATNCRGWVVKNSGDAPAMLYAGEWLPDGYALQINSKIDYELDKNATGTIVEHNTCTAGGWGSDEEGHWKRCACGRLMVSGAHTVETYANNGDGTHDVVCACGYVMEDDVPHDHVNGECPCGAAPVVAVADVDGVKFTNFANALAAWMNPDAKTLTLLADVETTETIGVGYEEEDQKVLDLNGFVLIDARNEIAPLMDVFSDLTIMNTSNLGTGVIKKTYVDGGAIWTGRGSTLKIVGDVKITGGYAIEYAGDVDLSEATSCIGWIVWHAGGTLTLPANTALKLYSDKLVHELRDFETATIVAHDHVAETYANNGDGTHDVVCECGYVMQDNVLHDHVNGVCLCGAAPVVAVADVDGVKFTNFADALAAWMNPEAKKLTLLADVETTVAVELQSGSKVLELNGHQWSSDSNSILVNKTNLTIQDSVGTGKLLLSAQYCKVVSSVENSTLTITGGTIEVAVDKANAIDSHGTLSISGNTKIKQVCTQSTCILIGGPATISGNVQIEASLALACEKEVDISGVTNCIGWTVKNTGGTLKMPANTALRLPDGTLVSELSKVNETATIVAHNHVAENYADNAGETHDVVCECGYVMEDNVPHAHVNGVCPCGAKAVASVTISDTTTYHGTLYDALTAANQKTATITLLADCEISSKVIFDSSSNVTLELKGKTITSSAELSVDHYAKLSIEGSGNFISGNDDIVLLRVGGSLNISGGNFTTTGNNACPIGFDIRGQVKISGNPTFSSSDLSEFSTTVNNVLDLRNATPPTSNGWRVQCWDPNGMAVDTTLILPNGYAMQNADGNIVTRLGREEVGTIVKHDEHTYVDGKCGCGEVCDHGFILPDGTCRYCKLHFVADVSINDSPATHYATLKDALNAAKGQTATISLLADCVLDEPFSFTSGSNVTLELYGKTITGTARNDDKRSGSLAVDTGATLTIEGEGKYTYTNNGYAGIAVEGTLNILSGTFEVTRNQAQVLHAKPGGEINISGGTFIVSSTIAQHVHTDGVVNISSTPKFTGLADNTTANEFSIGKGTLNLAKVTGNVVEGLRVVSWDNGVAVGPDANIILPDNYVLQDADGNIITSLDYNEKGTIVLHIHAAKNYADNEDGTHKVTCACGYVLESNAPHTYTEEDRVWKCLCGEIAVADVDGVKFVNFADAVAAWQVPTAKKLTLLANVKIGGIELTTDNGTQKVLELNGWQLQLTASTALTNRISLTIQDSSETGKGSLYSNNQLAILVTNHGELNITGGTFEVTGLNASLIANKDEGTLCISGVTTLKNELRNRTAVNAYGTVTISGDVMIQADTAISCYGVVDVSGANNCVGWSVTNKGGTLKLPAETALLVGDKLVQELEYSQRGTIVEHIHAAETYADNKDGTHKVTCACGYVLGSNAPHTYTEVEGRVWECPCGEIAVADVDGKKYTDFEDAVYAWQQISAEKLTLLADVEHWDKTDVRGNGALPKVLDLNGYTWRTTGTKSVLRVVSDLTIKNTAESKEGVIEQPLSHSYAIDTSVGSSLKIIGNVQISAEMAIGYEGAVDLSKATNCIDWYVYNSGNDSTLTLPPNTALERFVGDLVQELQRDESGTIVEHTHNYTTYGHDETNHWKVCVCGATDGVVTHNYTNANNETHHWTACTCGVTTAQVAHDFKYVDNQDGKTHKVSCDCGYEKASVNHDVSTGVCVCGAKVVADVDDVKFVNFADAVAAWEAPTAKKLTLLDNVEYGEVISLESDEAKTLDLNGKTLTSTASANYALYTACPLTINDSSTDRTGKFVADDIKMYVVYCQGKTLTLNGGTITTNRVYFVLAFNGTTTTINSDNVKLSSLYAAIKVQKSSDLIINGNGCDGWKIWNASVNPSLIQIPNGFHLEDEAGNMLETNDKLLSEKYTVIKVDHIHNWSYAANDTADTITATCDAAGCPKPQQSMTLVAPENLVYDGTAKTVTIDGSIEGVQMPSINITGDTTNVTEEGCTATITVAGVTATLSFKIVPASIAEATVSAEDQTYTGKAITPEVTVILDNKNLTLNTDYTVAYVDNVNVGTATITVTGKGNYTGTATGVFNIEAASIEAAQITVADQIYTGKEITPEVRVILGDKELTLNTDYTVAYGDNVDVGMAKVTINGKGNYTGTVEDTFTISLSGSALTAEAEAEYTYGETITVTGTITATGEVPEQQSNKLRWAAPSVTLFYGEIELGSAVVNGNAYTIEYNTMDKLLPIDTHTLTVEYSGDMNMAKSFTTVDVTLKAVELTITGAEAASRDYDTTNVVAVTGVTLNGILTGDEVSADVTGLTGTISSACVGSYDNITLPALLLTGEDAAYYTLKQPEDAVATTVSISPKEVEAGIELDEDTFVYDGNAKEPAVTAAKDGEHVIPATEYTVSYNNNTDVGTATVTLTDAEGGNYIVTGRKEFTITTSGAVLTAEAEAEYTYGETITVTGTITATGEVPEQQSNKLRVVAPSVTLFYGETVLGSAVVNGNAYTIEYDTTTKLLPVDKHTLTVKYSGSKNLADATATVTVSLMKAAPEYKVPAELTAVYGQTLATVTLPAGWKWNESVNAVGNVGVNSHKATFTPEDPNFYTTAEEELAVTVKPRPITDVTGPETKQLDVFCPTVEEIIAQLPTTLPGIGSDGQTYDIPVEWSFDGDEFNDDPEAENNFTWTAQSGDPFEIPENAAGTTVVKNGSAMEVTITGENKNMTYDGSTYNVIEMFIIDTNAGTAAYAITGGDGTGTLEGSVLTITKAGTFTIQVTTQTNVKDGVPYAPGEATAILTVSKGVPAYTVPTGLTATYGQTLQEISLNGFAGWTWKETTTKVGDAGDNTHTAVFTPENTDLWNTAEADVIITVAKADIQLAGVVKTFLVTEEGETETAVFTYGDTITVKAAPVMPVMMALADEMAMPQPNQMALYCGSKQISAPADAVDGLYTLTYQTTDKALAAGENEILVKYIGTDNFNSGMMSLNVTINPAELSIADVAVQNRPYMQGNLFVEVTKVDLAGKKLDTDDVAADLIGLQASVERDAVGKYAEVVLAEKINLKGADASFYTVKGGVAIKLPEGTEVEITKAKPEPEGTPDMGNVAPGNQLGDVPTDPIEDLFDVPGNVTWNDPADTPVEPGKEYEWTFTPEDDENYEPVTGSTVLVPVAPPQPPVPPSKPVDLPQIIWPAQDQFVTLNNGDTVTMPVSAINADRYQWFVNRNDGTDYVPVSGANTASLTITVNDKDNGNVYLCRVGNANGTVMSPVFHLEVLPAVDVPPTGDTVNTMLWAALLMLSAAGLLLVRKIKVNLG